MSNFKDMLGPMRLPFIILTPACVLLGMATAIWTKGFVSISHVIYILIGATTAHISVNAFNEYFDFKSGLDYHTKRTPFSGGSGTLPEKPMLARQTLWIAIITFVITLFIGLYFLHIRGLYLLPLGIVGLFLLYAYTPWLAYNTVLCLIAPGLGFGPLMVMGTHFALTGEYTWTALLASLIPFFLVSNLLLLNQFPDVEADRTIGRKNLPVVIGRRVSSLIYSLFLGLAYLMIMLGAYSHQMPKGCLIGLITIFLAVPAGIGAYKHAENIERLIPFMGANVIINIATPVLVAVGLLI